MGSGASMPSMFAEKEKTYGVYLHVYSLTAKESFGSLLGELSGMPALHSGVEIFEALVNEETGVVSVKRNGMEYAYGGGAGVWVQKPKQAPQFGRPGEQQVSPSYQETILIGTFTSKKSEVNEVIRQATEMFQAEHYDMLTKNCNHFSDYVAFRLTGKHIPQRINALARNSTAMAAGAMALMGGLLQVGMEVANQLEAEQNSRASQGHT